VGGIGLVTERADPNKNISLAASRVSATASGSEVFKINPEAKLSF
jgi:hypothetical protein